MTFTTVYPGWYQGRATHIHVEVTRNGQSLKVTQIAFPDTTNKRSVRHRRLRVARVEPDDEYARQHFCRQSELRTGDGLGQPVCGLHRDVHGWAGRVNT